MSTIIDWFGNEISVPEKPAKPEKGVNPCLVVYGPGPEGAKCKTCVHCRYPLHQSGRFWKCDLRRLTHGRATDHRVTWPACGKYEERQGEYHGG